MKKNAIDLIHSRNIKVIPSFDIGGGNIDFIEAAFQSATDSKGCMFLSSTPSTVTSYLGYKHYVEIIDMIASKYEIDYAIHLDHATQVKDVFEALEAGFSSVMYDGSHESFSLNIENTKRVIQKAKLKNASVEAELGIISGKEDEVENSTSQLPSIEDIRFFLEETNVDIFAPAVGTVHGNFKGEPKIDWELVKNIFNLNGYFVLHGCTGLDDETLKRAISFGYIKFNFATVLREQFRAGLEKSLEDRSNLKPFTYLQSARGELRTLMNHIFNILK